MPALPIEPLLGTMPVVSSLVRLKKVPVGGSFSGEFGLRGASGDTFISWVVLRVLGPLHGGHNDGRAPEGGEVR